MENVNSLCEHSSKIKIPKSRIDSMLREHKIWFDKREEILSGKREESDLGNQNTGRFLIRLDDIYQSDCDYTEINLKDAFLSDCVFINVDMSLSDFSNSILSNSDLTKNIFFGSNFRDSKMENVDFYKSDLRGVDFENAKLTMSCFDGCDLRSAKFTTEIIDIESFCFCKVSKRHLPWLALHPEFHDIYPTLKVY